MTELAAVMPELAPVLLGAFSVIALSVRDFHTSQGFSNIRYAVLPERYLFALSVYATVAVFFYFVILNFLWLLTLFVDPDSGSELGVPATIFIFVVAPAMPWIGKSISAMRRLMWTLARYPESVETLTALIARSPFIPSYKGRSEVVRELTRYGVPSRRIDAALAEDNKVLTVAAARILQEVCSLHVSFTELRSERRFQRFFSARIDLERQYRRLLRWVARAVLLTEDIHVSDSASDELALEVSDFIAEECEALRAAYQRQLAELTLSCFVGPVARTRVISDFGYQIYLPKKLPFVPLVIVFILDFVISVTPVIFASFPEEVRLSAYSAAVLALAHACALTVSVFFAIYPKTATNFARPSFLSLPWKSYALFGLISYFVGIALTSLAYRMIELPSVWLAAKYPILASSLFSLLFMISTIALSILLDLRLRDQSCDYQRGRLLDGVAVAIVMGAVIILLQLGIVALGAVLQVPLPDFPLKTRAVFTGLFSVLGFAMGYLVPSTAQAHIEAIKIILTSAENKGYVVGWATRDGQPIAP